MVAKRKPKTKKCRECKGPFEPFNTLQKTCCVDCAILDAKKEIAKKERKELKEAKLRIKTKAQWMKEAQAEFNKFIRLDDADLPCISCQRFHDGQYHAGHYLSVGAAGELRFEEDNCHKQCQPCNNHLSGNQVKYRVNLIQKIGIARVEWLEGPHDPKKYSVDEIKAIKQLYKDKCKIINQRKL